MRTELNSGVEVVHKESVIARGNNFKMFKKGFRLERGVLSNGFQIPPLSLT